jgi:hypothetical protein
MSIPTRASSGRQRRCPRPTSSSSSSSRPSCRPQRWATTSSTSPSPPPGRARGGPAKVAIFASGLMGMINGTSAGNVVATGSLTIPLMKKVGYHKKTAGAIEAAASTGGQIMPPIMGAGAFIMAEITGIPYQEIAIAAIIPAILYFASIYFMVDFEAAKLGMRGMREDELPKFKRHGAQGLPVPADHHPDRGALHGLFGDPGGHIGHRGRRRRQLGHAGTFRLPWRRQLVDPEAPGPGHRGAVDRAFRWHVSAVTRRWNPGPMRPPPSPPCR